MGIFNKIKAKLKIDKTNDESVIDEDTDPYYLLRFNIKEFENKAENFRWFFHRTECVGIMLTGNNKDVAFALYKSEEERGQALEIAKIRYETVMLDEDNLTLTKEKYYKYAK